MEALEKFTFFRSFWEAVKRLPKKDRYPILEAIIEYGLDGREPESLSDAQFAYFLLVEPVLSKGRNRAESGKQGGSKPKANAKQTLTHKDIHKEKDMDKDKEMDKENEKADKPPVRSRFIPPTIEEVHAYCLEQGYTAVSPERFVSYYQANGWKVGKNAMKDWKAAVRGWESRKQEKLPEKPRSESSNPFLDMLGGAYE